MKITVDGTVLEMVEGSALGHALHAAGSKPAKEAIIGVVKGRGEKLRETNSYWLETTKGKIRVELAEGELQKAWQGFVNKIPGCEARWSSTSALSFGLFPAAIIPGRDTHEYHRWEVVLGTSGFEADKTQLIFVKRRHSASYGSPAGRGVLGLVVGGKGVLDRLEKDDRILRVDPIVEWEDLTEKFVTSDHNLALEEGMEIYSRFEVDLLEDAPHGAEFFMAATQDGVFKTSATSSSYVSSDVLHREQIAFEHREPRLEGVVTVRTQGRGLGNIFIYKADRTSNPAHSVIGKVTSGMDLIKLSSHGQKLSVRVRPERIMLMGQRLSSALKEMQGRKIEVGVVGYQGEEAVIVGQEPATTMEVLRQGKVKLTSIHANRLVAIELYDDLAPKTLDYFRHVVGLKERPVGPLPIFFVYENTVLFKPVIDATSYKELLPENKPTGPVPAGSIGVSNSVSKKIGLIGVKQIEDKRYGPSGEKFEATNIIGRVLDLEKLKDVKEGETVYVLEIRP